MAFQSDDVRSESRITLLLLVVLVTVPVFGALGVLGLALFTAFTQ